jgi:tetrapyrrole methylase family protein/MazG family protein/ATP diphosphatase
VFGDARIDSARAQTDAWERQKAAERARDGARSVLDGVPKGLPALLRARKLVSRASRAGFAWPEAEDAADKVAEELAELRVEIASGDRRRLEEELGDLLFASASLAQRLELDAESALRGATSRFEARLRRVESQLASEGRSFAEADPSELQGRFREARRAD